MGPGRFHSREFKLMVVRQVASGEKRPVQVGREHGLTESLLLRWRREYEARGEAAFTPSEASGTARSNSASPSWNACVASWHSSLTKIRQRYGLALFRRFFDVTVMQCQAVGLI